MEKQAKKGKAIVNIESGNVQKRSSPSRVKNAIVSGMKFRFASLLTGFTVLGLLLRRYIYPWRVFHFAALLSSRKKEYGNTHPKIVKGNNKYYTNLYSPGWPSVAFNRYINHSLDVVTPQSPFSLFALAFAITNKCGFQCEHCVEWEQLNRKDGLSANDLVAILRRFHQLGISQVQLSGGEPANRFEDILTILDAFPKGIDFWMYTNGYQLTAEKAERLKAHGLTGVIISLDHYIPERHDQFRGINGSHQRALKSARYVVDNGLLLAFSCCATNDFISMENLVSYAQLCRDAGASFIQLLEPEAVGRYQQKDVILTKEKREILEQFFKRLNFDPAFKKFPIASYPALIKRTNGCTGSGQHFLYIDADGYVHACPFCKKQLFHALDDDLENKIRMLRERGCSLIGIDTTDDYIEKRKRPEKVKEEVFA